MQRAVGSGPWKLESFSVRERAVLARNADYWDAARVPKLGKVTLLPLPEPNTRVAAFRSNQVDFIEFSDPDYDAMFARVYETFDRRRRTGCSRSCTPRSWTTRCSSSSPTT